MNKTHLTLGLTAALLILLAVKADLRAVTAVKTAVRNW